MRGVKSEATQEFTYKSTESVEQLDISSVEMQYLYEDGSVVVFMNPRDYDQVEVPRKLLEDKLDLLTPTLKFTSCFMMTKQLEPACRQR